MENERVTYNEAMNTEEITEYANFEEGLEPVSPDDEFVRIQLTALGRALINKGVSCNLIYDDEDSKYILLVPIDGPENLSLALSLYLDEEYHMTLSALYNSGVLGEPVLEMEKLADVPDYDDIALNFVIRIAEDIYAREQEKIAKNTTVNDKNMEDK